MYYSQIYRYNVIYGVGNVIQFSLCLKANESHRYYGSICSTTLSTLWFDTHEIWFVPWQAFSGKVNSASLFQETAERTDNLWRVLYSRPECNLIVAPPDAPSANALPFRSGPRPHPHLPFVYQSVSQTDAIAFHVILAV